MNQNICPNCKRDSLGFEPSTIQNGKGKDFTQLGFYVCRNCGWKSDLQELRHRPIPKKKEMWTHQHFDKLNKRLFVWVYSSEPSQQDYTFYGQFMFEKAKIYIATSKEVFVKKLGENLEQS